MSNKRRKRKSKTNSSSGSDDARSPEEKKVRETHSPSTTPSSLDLSTNDGTMTQEDLGQKVDAILNRIVDID